MRLISHVTKLTLHIVILIVILLTACFTNQHAQFFLCCHYMSSTNSCSKYQVVLRPITLGQIKLTIGNEVFLHFRMILETCHAYSF